MRIFCWDGLQMLWVGPPFCKYAKGTTLSLLKLFIFKLKPSQIRIFLFHLSKVLKYLSHHKSFTKIWVFLLMDHLFMGIAGILILGLILSKNVRNFFNQTLEAIPLLTLNLFQKCSIFWANTASSLGEETKEMLPRMISWSFITSSKERG